MLVALVIPCFSKKFQNWKCSRSTEVEVSFLENS